MSIGLWPLFVALGLLSLALGLLLPTPSGRPAGLICAAVLFGIAAILAVIPGVGVG